ncbi:hypothetical protein P167DRAFT_534896 [Morchella conica CCBAS932]|uniref:Uncharacterized protein n=1 Tax=Morchella conica CCBAS932 TaxID=1392247 RepID=A0A3N4KVV3_9PEZI|nr:hypothetical protein P167DRAFT_534896 [Morchella conica CCBAS932]
MESWSCTGTAIWGLQEVFFWVFATALILGNIWAIWARREAMTFLEGLQVGETLAQRHGFSLGGRFWDNTANRRPCAYEALSDLE